MSLAPVLDWTDKNYSAADSATCAAQESLSPLRHLRGVPAGALTHARLLSESAPGAARTQSVQGVRRSRTNLRTLSGTAEKAKR